MSNSRFHRWPDLMFVVASIPNGALSNCKSNAYSSSLSDQPLLQSRTLSFGTSATRTSFLSVHLCYPHPHVLVSSKQTLILSTPGGAVASVTTLLCGWYSDRKVLSPPISPLRYSHKPLQNERMLPIVFCLIPTIVGAAMLVGLNGSANKGVLLFGKCHDPKSSPDRTSDNIFT